MKENMPLHLTPTASATMPPPGPGTWMLLSIVAQQTLEFRVGYIPAPLYILQCINAGSPRFKH